MNNISVTSAHFVDYKKKITYECMTMTPKVHVKGITGIEYVLVARRTDVRKRLSYGVTCNSSLTFVGCVTGVVKNEYIEVELLDIWEDE